MQEFYNVIEINTDSSTTENNGSDHQSGCKPRSPVYSLVGIHVPDEHPVPLSGVQGGRLQNFPRPTYHYGTVKL